MSFTKLFSSITASTIWNEPDHTRIVWITMLAMADRDGYIAASVPGLAVLARVPVESVVKAIESFTSPDPWSRTKEHDGRRIEEVDGGWRLLNYDKYRATRSPEDQREKTAARVQRYRERHGLKNGHESRDPGNAGVTPGNAGLRQSRSRSRSRSSKSIVSSNEETRAKAGAIAPVAAKSEPSDYTPDFEEFWEASWKRGSKRSAYLAHKRSLRNSLPETVLGAVKSFASAYASIEAPLRPHVATWLNQERYKQPVEDFLPPAEGSTDTSGVDEWWAERERLAGWR